MPIYAYIFQESPIRLWGLSSRQRLERMLISAGVAGFVKDISSIPARSSALLVRGDYLYDDRIINGLVETTDVALNVGPAGAQVTIAANVTSSRASQALKFIIASSPEIFFPSIRTETPETLSSSYRQQLRKSDPPFVLPITEVNRRDLEQRLFNSSYKGVTDLVTKWAWPRPARWCTRICVRYGVMPNYVTLMSLALVVLACVLFARGLFGWGLLAGWIMTFLDTVDGKLARVTITSSRFGHFFDHLIDLIHPPIWYAAWGLGLGVTYVFVPEFSMNMILWIIIGGYIVGRLVELTFNTCLGSFGIFCWRPVDSYFRLITARRNPNLILLTIGAATGYPDLGLLAVAFWTGLTSLFLFVRLVMAGFTRIISGPLHSWLFDIGRGIYDGSMAMRLFASQKSTQSAGKYE